MTGNGESKVRRFLTGCLAAAALVGVYCFATIGVSSLLMTATDISTQAKGGHGHGHFWHGHWWGYGEGPCWRWTPAGYVWICD